ncbi:MAG: putative HTH-type transcriptional regulator YgaV [Candidatus Erwinia impunctatus]|nr:putative HTH-type transcriptional regulator YgaV [Culicoides impunctatus]
MNSLAHEFERANEAQFFLKSISNPSRLLILCALIKTPGLSNSEIANICGISISSTSQYLVKMRDTGLIDREKKGKETHYFIKDERVTEIIYLLKKIF